MFPSICKIGPFTVYSYGLMLALAVFLCSYLLSRDVKKQGMESDFVFDFVFTCVLSGILGARIFYVYLNLDYFLSYPLEIIMIQKGGLAFQGGLLMGVIAAIIFIKRKGIPVLLFFDLVAPYLALGHSIGRIGCFLNGCCFGRAVSWGIYFPVHDAHLHPTQLYATLGLFFIYVLLKLYQKSSTITGQVFVLYIILASTLRFFIEFFRADHELIFAGLSIYQLNCLVFIMIGTYVYARLKSQRRTE